MPEPVTIGAVLIGGLTWVGAAGLGGAIGASTDRAVCKALRDVKDLFAGMREAPENADIARAVRKAQLQALERLIRDYRDIGRPEWQTTPHTRPNLFFERSLTFCDAAIARCDDPKFGPEVAVAEPLSESVLSTPPDEGPADRRRQAIAAFVETAVLDELRVAIDGVVLPEGFEAHFRTGASGRRRFIDLFGTYVSEQVKTNDGFRAVLTEGHLSKIEGLVFDATVMLERFGGTLDKVADDTTEIRADMKELLAIARNGGAFQRAADQGIPEAAVRAIVERLGGEGIGRDELIPWLDNWIETARAELDRRSNEGEAFEAAREEAMRRFREGRITDASAAFMEALERDDEAEKERQDERKRYRLRLLEEAVRFDELAFNGEAAVEKLRRMAAIEGAYSSEALGEGLFGKASEFYERGDQKGENGALLIAIAAYRAALEEWTRERVPFDWATTQNNLGNALQTLGARESGTARLEEAVATYRAALEETTRERVPLDWAITQSNLGSALQTLGARESGTGRLEEAVAAFRAALEETTRERVPLDWAMTQNNLGNALQKLGARESGTARLEEAVAAYRAALEEQTRERVPFDWATTQNNLGNALWRLGERESGTGRLEEAVAAFRAALEEMTRERVPLDWATTQNNLGTALLRLGERESGTARLEQAVAAYRAALEEWTRERVPLDWATTQNNLGTALGVLGTRESGTARLDEAVSTFRAAQEERTRDRVPLDWAATQNNLGNALRMIGDRESGTARLEEAVAAFRAALEERTRDRVPLDWAMTQNNLGTALGTLGARESGTARLEEAVAAFRAALEVCEEAHAAHYISLVRDNLEITLDLIEKRKRGEE